MALILENAFIVDYSWIVQIQKNMQIVKCDSNTYTYIYQMQQPQNIQFEIISQKDEALIYPFDVRILNFNIQYLSNNHHQPYPIPKNIVSSFKPLEIMKSFVAAHNFDANSVKITKPLKSSNYSENVDPITFKLFSKYCDEGNAGQAVQLIKLANFIRFHQLSEAVSSAIATNYYVGQSEKELEQFKKTNKLDDISSDQICEIIKNNEKQFQLIELKAKEELLKIEKQHTILEA